MAANLASEELSVAVSDNRYRIGAWVATASIVMLFTGLTSAYIVRSASAPDWQPLAMPRILWLSTTLILASSAALETARRNLREGFLLSYERWLLLTGLLGGGFLLSQLFAWRKLAQQGIYLASNPHSSFFYLLTGTHGLHLLGGLLAMSYLLLRTRREHGVERTKAMAIADGVSVYWHFLDGLWIYLFLLLFLWRSL
jgi:cytochrome c oxidase subunit 3